MILWSFKEVLLPVCFLCTFLVAVKRPPELAKQGEKEPRTHLNLGLRDTFGSPIVSQGVFLNGNFVPVMGPMQAAGTHISRGTNSISRKITPLLFQQFCHHCGVWEVPLTALGGKAARWVSPTECEWCAVIRVMASMGNDLKNSSNEIPCRSLKGPARTNPF